MLTISVARLLNQPVGSKEEHDLIDQNVTPITESESKPKISFHLTLYKLKEGISAGFQNITVPLRVKCDLCITDYTHIINILQAETIFYLYKPPPADMEVDFFLIDRKRHTIELDEYLRQEILLHFPNRKVCSKGCKGVCQICGNNLNQKTCRHKVEHKDNSYFNKLKHILSDSSQ